MALCSEVVGGCLANEHEVIISILNNLPSKDLLRKARVCKSWSQAAKQIMKKRNKPDWFIWTVTQTSESDEYCNSNKLTNELEGFLKIFFEESFCSPALCFVFANNTLKLHPTNKKQCPDDVEYNSLTAMTLVKDIFSKYCQAYGLIADGVVGSLWKSIKASELESVHEEPSVAALFLPVLPFVEIYQFVINDNATFTENMAVDEDFIHNVTHIPKDSKVKVLLLFSSYPGGGRGASAVAHFYGSKQDNIVIGGGIGDRVLATSVNDWISPHTLGVAFVGKSIRSASTVISREISCFETMENMFIKLKDADFYPNKIGFMFGSTERGCNFYQEQDVESELFQKVFPDVPLLVFFGDEEIGLEYIPNTTTCGVVQTKKSKLDLFHSSSSVFVIISFKES